jgi:hypothetical protein
VVITFFKEGTLCQHTCHLFGEIVRTLSLHPDPLVLKPDFDKEGVTEEKLTFTNDSDASVRLLNWENLPEGVTVEAPKSEIKPGETVGIACRVTNKLVTPLLISAAVFTSHPSERTISLDLLIQPEVPVQIIPSQIHLGVISTKEFESLRFKLLLRGKLLARFGRVHVQCPPVLRAGPVQGAADERFVEVTCGDARANNLDGEITITLSGDTGAVPAVRIPVSGSVRHLARDHCP